MSKSNPAILKHLKSKGRSTDLPLNVLRQFEEFEKLMNSTMESYEQLPPAVAYGMKSFTKVEALSIALMMEEPYKAVQRCFENIMSLFGNDPAFEDGVTLAAWIFFNFPVKRDGEAIASIVLKRSPELSDELLPFVSAMNESRLGLYETIREDKDTCVLKELFTGRETTLSQALGIPKGRIALIRTVEIANQYWAFGDTNEFPQEHRKTIEAMVASKSVDYFPETSTLASYESMMRLAGPYWFSIVARNAETDILDPDHYLNYYSNGKP